MKGGFSHRRLDEYVRRTVPGTPQWYQKLQSDAQDVAQRWTELPDFRIFETATRLGSHTPGTHAIRAGKLRSLLFIACGGTINSVPLDMKRTSCAEIFFDPCGSERIIRFFTEMSKAQMVPSTRNVRLFLLLLLYYY